MRVLIFSFLFLISSVKAKDLVVMSYNVENFFDSEDNPQTNDETYLPLKHAGKKKCRSLKSAYYKKVCQGLDWTEKKVSLKLSQHLKVLNGFPHQIDVLALIEVESPKVVDEFVKGLKLKGQVMSTGSDKRGINVALLFNKERFTKKSSTEIKPPFSTRNILEVTLLDKLTKKEISFFVNHWPSQRSPTAKRTEVAKLLEKHLDSLKNSVIALGDFNTLDKEFPSPFAPLRKTLNDASADHRGPGSYFYKRTMSWNMLDRIFYSKKLELKKFDVYNPEFTRGVTEYTRKGPFKGSRIVGLPKGYDHMKKKKPGYSDHFPIYAIFN